VHYKQNRVESITLEKVTKEFNSHENQ
jgi:hypothetical protein